MMVSVSDKGWNALVTIAYVASLAAVSIAGIYFDYSQALWVWALIFFTGLPYDSSLEIDLNRGNGDDEHTEEEDLEDVSDGEKIKSQEV
ncbi:hypothetical protein [Saliphagus infecundisoli]|uniref:Uncharacterized protein n=1 Tax=Saliphagus infecundisoli TaxID=1849069 RepID=A0ABD5QLE2_9EURY|nr:hypothetical protein [Saliphagus infecundisoli]